MTALIPWVLLLGPWLLGAAALVALLGRPRRSVEWLVVIGGGFPLGAVAWGLLLRWAPVDLDVWSRFVFAPLLAGIVLLAAGWRRRSAGGGDPGLPDTISTPMQRGLWWLLLGWLAVLGLSLAVQVANLPTLAWDAWTVWMTRPKAWAGAGQLLPFVEFEPWLRATPGSVLFSHAAGYPDTLPRFSLWIGLLDGVWSEARAARAWPLLWLSLGLASYGHLRGFGLRPVAAMAAVWCLLGLPLLSTHVALFGYSDLWVGVVLAFGLAHATRAARARSRSEALAAALFLLLLPAIKFEGGVWLLCVLGGLSLTFLKTRGWRGRVLAAAAALLLVSIWLPLPFPLPGLGWASWEWGAITLPQLGRIELSWRPVLAPVLASLFLHPNWALLWPAVLVMIGVRFWRRRQVPAWMALSEASLALGGLFLFLLFFFTDAARWAEDMTSLNRVLLQIVPATVVWAAVVATLRPAVRGRYS